jgi:hypothetical protein
MKKFNRISALVALTIVIVSAVFLIAFSGMHHSKGHDITAYDRFHKEVNGKREFNYWALVSPVQTESQSIVNDTVRFTERVYYPLAPVFKVVAQAIADTVNKVKLDLGLDYDQQSTQVRAAHHVPTPKLTEPHIFLSLHGTASPEAANHGFNKSIKPGNFEPENAQLAAARVERTHGLLIQDLKNLGIDSVTVASVTSEELQFSETDVVDSSTAVAMFPDMRYVIASVDIPMQRLVITPAIAPVALPIWLIGLLLLALLLRGLGHRKSLAPADALEEAYAFIEKSDDPKSFYDRNSWWILFVIIVLGAIITLVTILWFFGWYILMFLVAVLILWLMIWIHENLIKKVAAVMAEYFAKKAIYWSDKPWTCKFVALWFVLTFLLFAFLFITWLMGLWHICF